MKNLRFDPFKFVTFKTVSAGFLISIFSAWFCSARLAGGLFVTGGIVFLVGEWYAREIYREPMPETYKSVVLGGVIVCGGFFAASALVNILVCNQWLHPFLLVWCMALALGPQIAWQRRKIEESRLKAAKEKNVLGHQLRRNKRG